MASFCIDSFSTALIQWYQVRFYQVKLENSYKSVDILGNKHGIMSWAWLFLGIERSMIKADFDHLLNNHFWIMNVHVRLSTKQQISNLQFSSSFNWTLDSTYVPKIYYLFENHHDKFSCQNGLPGLLPVGQVSRQSYLPERKMYSSRPSIQIFFSGPASPGSIYYFSVQNRPVTLKIDESW